MKKMQVISAVFVAALMMYGCQQEEAPVPNAGLQDELSKSDKSKGRPKTTIWADGILYGSVVTPATFKGNHNNYDKLYGGTEFKDGVALISESKPGDQDYNGGKWDLYVLKPGVSATKYQEASSDMDLDLDDFMQANPPQYFGCPLTPLNNGL